MRNFIKTLIFRMRKRRSRELWSLQAGALVAAPRAGQPDAYSASGAEMTSKDRWSPRLRFRNDKCTFRNENFGTLFFFPQNSLLIFCHILEASFFVCVCPRLRTVAVGCYVVLPGGPSCRRGCRPASGPWAWRRRSAHRPPLAHEIRICTREKNVKYRNIKMHRTPIQTYKLGTDVWRISNCWENRKHLGIEWNMTCKPGHPAWRTSMS